jgi:hypothetical protein
MVYGINVGAELVLAARSSRLGESDLEIMIRSRFGIRYSAMFGERRIESVPSSPARRNQLARGRVAWLRLLRGRGRACDLDESAILSHVRTIPSLALNTYGEDEIVSFRSRVAHCLASGADADDDIARLLDGAAGSGQERRSCTGFEALPDRDDAANICVKALARERPTRRVRMPVGRV